MATPVITHAKVSSGTVNSNVEVDLHDWNNTHVVTGLENVPNVDTTNASNLTSGTVPAARMPALTGDVTSSAGSTVTTLAAGNAGNLNSGTLLAARMPALTGDITSAAGSTATTLVSGSASNLNSGTLAAARLPNFTQSGTGAVARTIFSKIGEVVSVKDFGAVGDGVTDDTTAVANAIASLGSAGGTIIIPNGCFCKIGGNGTQIFLITAPIRFVGPGFGAGGFFVTAATSSTTDIFRIAPATNTTLFNVGMTGCQIVPLSGTPGRHVWNFDTTTGTTTTISEFLAEDCYFGAFGNYTFFNNTGGSTTSGGIFSSHFVRNVCAGSGSTTAGGGFGGANWGDSNHINGGRFAGNGYAVNINLFAGAGNFILENANIVCSSMVKIDGGYKIIIQNNTFEQQLLTNTSTNNTIIDLNGGVAPVINATVTNNLIVVGSGLGNPTPLRINNASTTIFDINRFSTPSAYAPVVSTASASSIVVGGYNAFSGTGALSLAAGTVAINLAGGQIPGTTTNDNAVAGYVGEFATSTATNASSTVTISNASPGIVSWASHGLNIGSPVNFTTTGALPTGLSVGTNYYVSSQSFTANSFAVSTSVANALAGTSVNTSSAGSGTHTAKSNVIITTANPFNITGLSLTAGDWDVWGTVISSPAGGALQTQLFAWTSTTSATVPTPPAGGIFGSQAAFAADAQAYAPALQARYSLSATTTIYLSGLDQWTTGTNALYGVINARRRR